LDLLDLTQLLTLLTLSHNITIGEDRIENTSSNIYFIVSFIQPLPSNGGLSVSQILALGKYVTICFPHQYANVYPHIQVSNEFTKVVCQ
jgi:hypothetical protein